MIELLIIGDSLSAPHKCEWPRYLQNYAIVRNLAQAGLKLAEYDYPDHLKLKRGAKAVIYIGGNDVLHDVYRPDSYSAQLGELVQRLQSIGAEVYLIGQPYLSVIDLDAVRETTREVAGTYGAQFIQPGWGGADTFDGVHQTCATNKWLAIGMFHALGLEAEQ